MMIHDDDDDDDCFVLTRLISTLVFLSLCSLLESHWTGKPK